MQHIETLNLNSPKGWNHLTTPQLEWLQGVYERRMENESQFLAIVFLGIMGIVVEDRPCEEEPEAYYCHLEKDKEKVFLIRPYEIYAFSQKLKWILSECKLTRSPYPLLKIGKQEYRGPANKLSDFSWKQYKMASDFYTLYMDSVKRKRPNDVLLYKFIATLFTPKRLIYNAELQGKEEVFSYSPSQWNNWGAFRKRFTDTQVKVIFMFWNGCCGYLADTYRHLFRPASKSKGKNNPEDMLKMEAGTMAVIMDRLKITESEINACSMFTILQMLDTMQLEAEKQKDMVAKMKR